MSRRLLVTGAAGHIGSALLRSPLCTDPEAEVTVLDDFRTGRVASLFGLPRPIRLIERDLLDTDLAAAVTGQDVVIHLAALTDAAGSIGQDEAYTRVNTEGVNRLARACRDAGVPLIFLSTTSVYGPQTGRVDESLPIEQYAPQSPYAVSKWGAELILRQLYGPEGLRYVILRCGTVYGTANGTAKGWRHHTAVNRFSWQAAHGLPITVWRDAWDARRPYLALDSLLAVIADAACGRWVWGWNETFNVVTGNHTVREVVDVFHQFVPNLSVEEVDSPLLNQQGYAVTSLAALGAGPWPPEIAHRHLTRGIKETLQLLRPDVLVSAVPAVTDGTVLAAAAA